MTSPRVAANWEAAAARVSSWRGAGEAIAFTNGCFDLLHAGHVAYLEQARALGDRLIVGLNDDASVARLKGPARPLQPRADRAVVLAALRSVDLVVAFAQDTPLDLIRALRPDVLAKGGDYAVAEIVGADDVIGWGGRVEVLPFVAGRSTTALVERLTSRRPPR